MRQHATWDARWGGRPDALRRRVLSASGSFNRLRKNPQFARGSRLEARGKNRVLDGQAAFASSLELPASGPNGVFERPVKAGRTPERGVTLSELLVVSVIAVIFLAGLLTVFLMGRKSYLVLDAGIRVQDEARKAFNNIVRELRESGNISCEAAGTGCVGATDPTRRLNVQIARGYDQASCGGICWGSEAANGQWVHYEISGTGTDEQLVRCVTGGETDALPAGYAGCRVLANDVNGAASVFRWDATNRTVVLDLQTQVLDSQLPTGSVTGPTLSARVRLRN